MATHHTQQSHQAPEDGLKGLFQNWQNDLVAALSVALIALPLGLGIAAAGGVDPMAGVISAIVGGLITTFLRGSHVAINGPGNGLIVLIITSLTALDDGSDQVFNYLIAAFILSGVLTTSFGVLRLGRLGEIFPSTVVYGMMAAIGFIIIGSQFHSATGNVSTTSSRIGYLLDIPQSLDNLNLVILAITLLGIGIMVIHSKIHLKLIHFIPGPVWVLAITLPAVFLFDFLYEHQIMVFDHVYNVGPDYLVSVPEEFLSKIPQPNFSRIGDSTFWGVVVTISFVSSLETIVSARATEKLDPFERKFNLNRELIGTGLGTIISGFLGGLPVMTVVARSSVNVTHGAKTRWSNFFHGVILLGISVFALHYIHFIPIAALSAILIFTGYHLISSVVWRNIAKKGGDQLAIFTVTIVATIFTGLIYGVLVGMAFTLIFHMIRSNLNPLEFLKLQILPELRIIEDRENHLLVRAKGVLNFLTLPRLRKIFDEFPLKGTVSVTFSSAPLIDLTVMEYLRSFRRSHVKKGGDLEFLGLEQLATSSDHPNSLRYKSKNPVKHHRVKMMTGRQRQIMKLCAKHEWTFQPDIWWDIVQLPRFLFFELRPIAYSQNVILGNYEHLRISWEISDVIFAEGSILATEEYEVTCQLINLRKPLPEFTIEKGGFIDKIVESFGYQSIDYLTFTDRSENYIVKAHQEEDLQEILSEELMEFIEQKEVYHIECSGDALVIFNHIRQAAPKEIQELYEIGEVLVQYLQPKDKVLET